MKLDQHQKLVLAIAAVLAFGIWLFPHWRAKATSQLYPSVHWQRDVGYSFLFSTPNHTKVLRRLFKPDADSQRLAEFEITLTVDWQRQFYEWGTLVFVAGFALAGLAAFERSGAASSK